MKAISMDDEVRRIKINAIRRASRKKLPKEDEAQMEFVAWATTGVDLIWHTPNARRYSRASWEYWKRMGVKPGILDVMIVHMGINMAFEFKRPGEKPSPEQKYILGSLSRNGWKVTVSYSFEDAKKFFQDCMKNCVGET